MTFKFGWQEKYTAATLELDRAELPLRIDAAERAIYRRIEELKHAGASSTEELWAMNDALRGLLVLAKTECQTQRSPQSNRSQNDVAL